MLRFRNGGTTAVSSKVFALITALTLILPVVVATLAADSNLPRDRDYDYDPPAPGSYRSRQLSRRPCFDFVMEGRPPCRPKYLR